MFEIDPLMKKGIVAFLIPTALGAISYVAATLAARFISAVPRHVYIGRLAFLAFFILLIWTLYMPYAAEGFSGTRERYYEHGIGMKSMGTSYGMHTVWIWCILALLKRPKIHHEDAA